MRDEQLLRLLAAIRDLAMLPYPYPTDATVCDERLPLALGQIAGLAVKALAETGRH